jgi:hypothetical protein
MGCIEADDALIIQNNTVPNQVPLILKSLGISSFTILQTNFCDGNLCNANVGVTTFKLSYWALVISLVVGSCFGFHF